MIGNIKQTATFRSRSFLEIDKFAQGHIWPILSYVTKRVLIRDSEATIAPPVGCQSRCAVVTECITNVKTYCIFGHHMILTWNGASEQSWNVHFCWTSLRHRFRLCFDVGEERKPSEFPVAFAENKQGNWVNNLFKLTNPEILHTGDEPAKIVPSRLFTSHRDITLTQEWTHLPNHPQKLVVGENLRKLSITHTQGLFNFWKTLIKNPCTSRALIGRGGGVISKIVPTFDGSFHTKLRWPWA